ncbi:hypothetical protein RhiirA5_396157 [Rhizophagus irregularis]|uniref:F-box domain-containing protein n=4 Tax=Rhizophagus irregularis TaxID=588596 RepID=A0A2I1EB99_9GLOM|nr:hypothetical protein GLOIN_2v1769480 [Rhizophagus irregularis DAOM 181602=DAOM 197198]EXX54617.1 hypothetical protein RirG_232880 [Rhizophagus irregularis DAOM 197198w]PKC13600.1 hypothetical protein RhiirA5_396157 [Rhizophagus irregularis]PKC73598.1 hypothetical protein RhiirA1_437474 [Rhizophagus irregularis]PKY19384.1 hypothetical protein RhiirB3_432426 [Rhizophagus irregularis]POG76054.1 hypothetical protein GLOIN_2v1769480 [Rhizophagus irregularis DAOM 181602=DAOM 197198]|eukprot:XP_025182920.1 hypothetical protein GLOIN_2v1769480 [Rhizophagus irregularis DAOM 181602=DAOM 197198]
MASFLLLECLEKVFLNLLDETLLDTNCHANISTRDLYSCTLVSRHWCRISTPILYAYPFNHFRRLAYSRFYYNIPNLLLSYFKLIRTLLNCIPKSEIEQINLSNSHDEQNLLSEVFHFDEKFYSSKPMFNYITFIRSLIFDKLLSDSDKLVRYRKIWFPPFISDINITENQFSKISIHIINYFVKFLCEYCNNLITLEFPFSIQNDEFFNDTIELLFGKNCNGNNKLNDLKQLYYTKNYGNERGKDLYLTFSNNVFNLNLLYNEKINSIEEANSLSQFISSQKKLQHIILSENRRDSAYYVLFGYNSNIDSYYNIVLNSLSAQSESLQTLEFNYIPFGKINKEALNSLCLLKNIRVLKLHNCIRIDDNLIAWAKNLTRLEVFELVKYQIRNVSEGFLIQLLQSSSNTLIRLVVNYKKSDCQSLLQQIPLHLNSLIHLDLAKIYSDELILIFKSCTRLVYISVILSNDELWGIRFMNLGKLIPRNLLKIQLKEMDRLLFDNKQLKCFFEECVNNDSKLKYLEIIGNCDNIKKEYSDVANDFSIQLITYSPVLPTPVPFL